MNRVLIDWQGQAESVFLCIMYAVMNGQTPFMAIAEDGHHVFGTL